MDEQQDQKAAPKKKSRSGARSRGKTSKPKGRPPGCTPEVIKQFAKRVREGCTMEDAADLAGVGKSTAQDWLARGQAGDMPYRDFSEAVTRARADAKAEAIRQVRQGALINGRHDWKASAFFLERQYPDEYGPQQAVHVKVEKELEKALDKLKEKLPADAYDAVLGALAGEAGGEAPAGEKG